MTEEFDCSGLELKGFKDIYFGKEKDDGVVYLTLRFEIYTNKDFYVSSVIGLPLEGLKTRSTDKARGFFKTWMKYLIIPPLRENGIDFSKYRTVLESIIDTANFDYIEDEDDSMLNGWAIKNDR